MQKNTKTLLSGIKPTGRMHLGNYFGAIKQFSDLQGKFSQHLIFIANYHALTTARDSEKLKRETLEVVATYLACGLDPEEVHLFLQTDVPQVTELCWIFDTLTTMPELMRAHAFKDSEAKSKDVSVGLFNYPMLMSADIVIQGANVVPVGKDQAQHVEIAREVARAFNSAYGDTLVEPQALIQASVETVPGTDGQKMSKSYGNVIPLFGTDEEWKKSVFGIVTDSKTPADVKNPNECNIMKLHFLVNPTNAEKIAVKYRSGGIGYKESKEALFESIKTEFSEMREKYNSIISDEKYLLSVLKKGGGFAFARAEETMRVVRKKCGLIKAI